MKKAQIFLSYRRDSSAGYAGRLYDNLTAHLPVDVFMDVDAIPPGVDFADYIGQAVGGCDVLLALIGPDWATATDTVGQRRLDSPRDFVRTEIAAALERRIRVIPVLLQGATMPTADQLPEELVPLTHRQALDLDNNQWQAGMTRLVTTLGDLVASKKGTNGDIRTLEVSASSLDFGTLTPHDPWPRRTVQIRDAGGGELHAATTTNESWIILRNRGSALDVLVDTSYPGDYAGKIKVASQDAEATITVRARIETSPPIPPVPPNPPKSTGDSPTSSSDAVFIKLIPTYMVRSILAAFLFAPAGIVAVVFAAQVKGKKTIGDITGAVKASKRARFWSWVAFIGTILIIVLAIINGMTAEDEYYSDY